MTHDQVRQLVRRVNPIPDPSLLESVDASVLDMERSMEMQVDERPLAEASRDSRWRGPVIGIAAAAVILIVGLIYINTSEDNVATPAPNAMPLPDGDFPILSPGAYYVDTDNDSETATRGTFVIENSRWVSLLAGALREGRSTDSGEYVSLMVVEVEWVSETPCLGGAVAPPGATAKALGDQFAALRGFITREGLAPVSAFGHDGYHLVLEVPADCNFDTSGVWAAGAWGDRFYQAEGQVVEYWFLDVEGTTVMVEATRPPETGEDIVTELNTDLDTVLHSLVITP